MLLVKKNNFPSFILYIFTGLLFIVGILYLYPHIPSINAYDAYCDGPCPIDTNAVPPPVVPCLDTSFQGASVDRDPEFHSMRPYQASPCGDAPKAYFCNNDYTIVENLDMRYDPGKCAGSGGVYICQMTPNATINGQAVFIIGGQDGRDYYITLSKVQYPIVGNTQEVRNSQSALENIDSAQRLNEYVDWYLQGRLYKAEYGDVSRDPYVSRSKWNSYAGPANNLVPLDYLHLQQLDLLHAAGVKPPQGVDITEYQGDPALLKPDPASGGFTTEQTFAHNQIAVCHIGGLAIFCYRGDGSRSLGDNIRLLRWWEGKGSVPGDTYWNNSKFADWTDTTVWGGLTPPFPWLFTQEIYYRKAYREWKGDVCVIVNDRLICVGTGNTITFACNTIVSSLCQNLTLPLGPTANAACVFALNAAAVPNACAQVLVGTPIEILPKINGFCENIGSLLSHIPSIGSEEEIASKCQSALWTLTNVSPVASAARNIYADLYRYIPLGNPSDKNAGHYVSGIGVRASGQTIATIINYIIEKNPVLHYPHTQSTVEEAKLINKMHTPLECNDDMTNCDPISGFGPKYEPKSCTFVDVRTNPGDSLTFNAPPTYLFVNDIRTRVDQVECSNSGQIDEWMTLCNGTTHPYDNSLPGPDSPSCTIPTQDCNPFPRECAQWPMCRAQVSIEVRSIPKIPYVDQLWKETVVGANSAFRKIFPRIEENAPVSCIKEIPGVSPVTYITSIETNLTRISTAGPNNYPGNGPNSQSPGQLFFPHLGTVYEYFLKGIQTALRPVEFSSNTVPSGTLCADTLETGACKMWLFERDSNGQFYYEKIVDMSGQVTCNGRTLNPGWALFIALNEDAGLMTDNIDGWGDDHFGCDQDDQLTPLDSVEDKFRCMARTLANDCNAGKTDAQTLQEYGYPPDYQFGYLQILLGQAVTPGATLPPLFGSDAGSNNGNVIANLLAVDWFNFFQQFAPTFCPNSPELTPPSE